MECNADTDLQYYAIHMYLMPWLIAIHHLSTL